MLITFYFWFKESLKSSTLFLTMCWLDLFWYGETLKSYTADCKKVYCPYSTSLLLYPISFFLSDKKNDHVLFTERERESDWSFIYIPCVLCVCERKSECGLLIATVVDTTLISHTMRWMLFFIWMYFLLRCCNIKQYKVFFFNIFNALTFFFLSDQTSCLFCGDCVWTALDDECLSFFSTSISKNIHEAEYLISFSVT